MSSKANASETWEDVASSLSAKDPFSLASIFVHWRMKAAGLNCIGVGKDGDKDKEWDIKTICSEWKPGKSLCYRDDEGQELQLVCSQVLKGEPDAKLISILIRLGDFQTSAVTLDLGRWVTEEVTIKDVHEVGQEVDKLLHRIKGTEDVGKNVLKEDQSNTNENGGYQHPPGWPSRPPSQPPGHPAPSPNKPPPPEPFSEYPDYGNEPYM